MNAEVPMSGGYLLRNNFLQKIVRAGTGPLDMTKDFVTNVLYNMPLEIFFATFLILFFIDFLLLGYNGMPASCSKSKGACRQIALNVFTMFYTVLMIFIFIIYMKLTASGVKKHGLNTNAFINVFSLYLFSNLLQLFLVALFDVFRPNMSVITNATGPNLSFFDSFRGFVGFVINSFSGDGTNFVDTGTGEDSLVFGKTLSEQVSPAQSVFLGSLLGIVAGVLSK